VGIYAGNGWVIEALDARHGVVARAAKDPYRAFRPASEFAAPATIDPRAVRYPARSAALSTKWGVEQSRPPTRW
jgi:hypothetical protein